MQNKKKPSIGGVWKFSGTAQNNLFIDKIEGVKTTWNDNIMVN